MRSETDERRTKLREALSKKLQVISENVGFFKRKDVKARRTLNRSVTVARAETTRKTEEAAALVQRMATERLERHRRGEKQRQLSEERRTREAEIGEQEARVRVEEAKLRKKEEMECAYHKLRLEREEERKRQLDWQKRVIPQAESAYLYKRLEERYNREVVLPLLEEKKQELAKKRNVMKPMTMQEIAEHQRVCEEKLREHEEMKVRELRAQRVDEEKLLAQQKRFETKISLKYSLQAAKAKEEQERKSSEKRQLRAKMRNYANLVKEVFPVKPSETKSAELRKKIEQLHHPVRQSRDTRKQYDLSLVSSRRKREARSHSILASQTHIAEVLPSSAKGTLSARKNLRREIRNQQAMLPISEKPNRKPEDYLAELRRRRAEVSVNRESWTKDLSDPGLNPVEKCNRVVSKANMLEERAKMKEKVLQARGGTERDPELCESVTDMFIQAIKAKLAVLDQI